ncbi:PQ-loop repeat-containing protein [Gracilimonas sp. Q87]|uniref:PQ-loop repeat-containing protein n=1 Tax=Gracilimonas sp. Q87 TaxID=3384766 RepID=UPI0039845BCC
MTGIELMGWAGFGILVAAWIPQTIDTVRRGSTQINLAFVIMYFTSSLLLTIYSILISDPVFTALNALLTLGSGINMYYKFFPRKEG